ncbi:YopX family protein [Paenibacillus polymyxa]|uniref:YopX family protein n=1 Tax=Paenibacillus polymyxa TaxID=1406 RepID=UPI002ED5171F|nr:YopX family protein [Paenibacillus polymyxa]
MDKKIQVSRPIKFRVWDKDLKRMHTCGEDVHDSITFGDDNEAYYYNLQNGEGSGEDGAYELMQYTGLKDRNGKEIYEGDIVEELDYSDGAYFPKERQPKKRTVVEYDIGFVYARAAYNLRGGMENGLYKGEVIGNIYETPLEDTP